MDAETLKAISARVRRARHYLSIGRHDEAERILDALASVLPVPDSRHLKAAAKAVNGELLWHESEQ